MGWSKDHKLPVFFKKWIQKSKKLGCILPSFFALTIDLKIT